MAEGVAPRRSSRSDATRRGVEILLGEAPATRGLIVSGPAGIGKSRLAEAIVDALPGDVAVVRAIATPSSATIPFGAFAHLLTDDAGTPRPDLEPPGLLWALRQVRCRLDEHRRGRPLVLVVDDAHVLDDPSATLVHQVVAAGDGAVLSTIRSGEPLPDPVAALRRVDGVESIELAPLTVDEVSAMAHAVLGAPMERASTRRLHHLSGGNPLFIRELLADARAEGQLSEHRGLLRWRGCVAVPGLAALVALDLQRVSAPAADLIDAVALGEPVPVLAARQLADLATLVEVEDRGIVVVDRLRDGQVRLAHPLFGEVRRAGMGPLRATHLALRLARAFEIAGCDRENDQLRVVNWLLQAGEPVDSRRLARASDRARALGDEQLAEHLARRSLAATADAETELLLAEVLEATGRAAEAARLLDGLPRRLSTDPARARATACQLRVLALGLGRLDAAEASMPETTAIDDPAWQEFVLAQWATLLAMFGRLADAEAVVEPLCRHDDERVRLRSLPALNLISYARGRLDEALERAQSLVGSALARRDEVPTGVSVVFSALSLDLLALGRPDDVDALVALASDPSAGTGANQAFLLLVEGTVALRRGRVSGARHLLNESLARFDESDPQGFRPAALGLLTQAAALAGDRDAARRARDECVGALDRRRPRLIDFDTRRTLAWAAVADADPAGARRALLQVARDARSEGLTLFESEALHDAVRLGAGDRVVRRLATVASDIDGPRAVAMAEHARARRSGQGVDLEAASASFERLGELLVAAELAAEAARAHEAADVAAAARRAAGRSRTLAARCPGAVIRLELGPDRWTLTPRELQVARLAAAGASNPQIAAQLGVSPRTVGNQLGRVYDKLGLRGRGDLGAVLQVVAAGDLAP